MARSLQPSTASGSPVARWLPLDPRGFYSLVSMEHDSLVIGASWLSDLAPFIPVGAEVLISHQLSVS